MSNGGLAEMERLRCDAHRAARVIRAMTNMTAAARYIDSRNQR